MQIREFGRDPNSGQFQKGHIMSEEIRKKISKTKKGWIPSEEWRKKMSILEKKQYREGRVPYWLGKKMFKVYKEKQERNDSAYLQWVKAVKKRDNNTCKFKNKDCSGYNIVHHIKSWSEYPELRYDINNGITLCQAHHPRKRAEEKRLIPFFQGLVSVSNIKI